MQADMYLGTSSRRPPVGASRVGTRITSGVCRPADSVRPVLGFARLAFMIFGVIDLGELVYIAT
jgi:hypothetical protein